MFDKFLNMSLNGTLPSNLLTLVFLPEIGNFPKTEICVMFLEDQATIRNIFITQPFIYDGAFFAIIVNGYYTSNIFTKKLHQRFLTRF